MIWALAGAVTYLTSAIALLVIFFKHHHIPTKLPLILGIFALVCHAIYISTQFDLGQASSYNLLLVVNIISLMISIVSLGFALYFKNFFVIPVCFSFTALVALSALFVPANLSSHSTWSLEVISHISSSLFAYAMLIIATLLSIQYSFISQRLKSHDLSFLRLPIPPLNLIEKQIFNLLLLGTSLLTCSIILGIAFLDDFFGSGQAHKAVLSILGWLCFVILLIGHKVAGWRGNITLFIMLSGASFLSIGYFGSRFIRDIVLS